MIKRSRANWTVKQFLKRNLEGQLSFDNVIQRGLVWTVSQKSLLIHTLMVNYPVPLFYALYKNGVYDMIDGKQRFSAINQFVNEEYKLKNVEDVVMNDGQIYKVDGLKFSGLPEVLRDTIMDYAVDIELLEDATEDEIKEIFVRLNSGKALAATDLTKAQAKSLNEIVNLSRHSVFTMALSEGAKNNSTAIDIIMKAYVILFCENHSLETKKIRPLMRRVIYTRDQEKILNDVFSYINTVYMTIKDKFENKAVLKKVSTKTHFVTLIPIVKYALDNGIDAEIFSNWVIRFFSPENMKKVTISEEYDYYARSGSSKDVAVDSRVSVMLNDFKTFIKPKDKMQ